MQTAALVYRPLLPAADELSRADGIHFAPERAEPLRILVAGGFNLPMDDVADHLSRCIRPFNVVDFQSVLDCLAGSPSLDLVLLDAALPGLEGAEGVLRIRDLPEVTPVVVMCHDGEEKKAADFLRNGAAGVVPGHLAADAIAGVLQLVLSGQRFAPAELLIGCSAAHGGSGGGLMDTLSSREKEVARLIAQGCPNKEIACRLGLQEITIKVYASSIFRKLGVRNRTAAAARLIAAEA